MSLVPVPILFPLTLGTLQLLHILCNYPFTGQRAKDSSAATAAQPPSPPRTLQQAAAAGGWEVGKSRAAGNRTVGDSSRDQLLAASGEALLSASKQGWTIATGSGGCSPFSVPSPSPARTHTRGRGGSLLVSIYADVLANSMLMDRATQL